MELIHRLVVPRVAARWRFVGLQLELSPARLDIVHGNHVMNMEECCTAMFEEWLRGGPGTGNKQRVWESVLRAVDIGHGTTEGDHIRDQLREPAASLAPVLDSKVWKIVCVHCTFTS